MRHGKSQNLVSHNVLSGIRFAAFSNSLTRTTAMTFF